MRPSSVHRSVKLPPELDAKLSTKMVELDRSRNWIVVKALERELDDVSPTENPYALSRPRSKGAKSAGQLLAEMKLEEQEILRKAEEMERQQAEQSSETELRGLENHAEAALSGAELVPPNPPQAPPVGLGRALKPSQRVPRGKAEAALPKIAKRHWAS